MKKMEESKVTSNPEVQHIISPPSSVAPEPQLQVGLVEDCEIDDMELMGSKKHLTTRGQPLTVIEGFKGKHKSLSFEETVEKGKDLKTNKDMFTVTWSLKGYQIQGSVADSNKQKARHMAAQRFLKALFHNKHSLLQGTHFTWISMLDFVQKKKPLIEILDLNE
jgi:hypothetical protein